MMKSRKVIDALNHRIEWLSGKLATHTAPDSESFKMLSLERAAIKYARDLVQREDDYAQRLRLEDRFKGRTEAYFGEFLESGNSKHDEHFSCQ